MKKRILTLGIVLALVALLVAPMAVAADDTVVTADVAETPTVASVAPPNAGVGTNAVTITGTNFIVGEPATVVVSGAGVSVGAVTVASTTSITTTFIIAADAAAGARDVSVTVGGKTGTGTGNFTVNGYITVTAPTTGADLGLMTAGATKTAQITGGTVASNWATWSVSAIDAKTTAKGYMNTAANGSGTSLAAKFQISKTAGSYTDADGALSYTGNPTTLPFYISQVVAADAPAGSYQITITFTGSGS